MGEHSMYGKNMLYESVYRIPLIIRWPGELPADTVVDRLISNVDFMPTILTILGVSATDRIQGENASHLIADPDGSWTDEVYTYQSSNNFAGIVTPQWYFFIGKPDETVGQAPNSMLFDRINDPLQENNLIDDEEYQPVVQDLLQKVYQHHRELNTPAVEWLSAAL
jgi:uncharacterized sulfatase